MRYIDSKPLLLKGYNDQDTLEPTFIDEADSEGAQLQVELKRARQAAQESRKIVEDLECKLQQRRPKQDMVSHSFASDPFGRQDFKRLRAELPQLLAALAVYSIGVYTNSVTQAYLQKHADWFAREEILWDFGFHNLPKLDIVFIDWMYRYGSIEVNLPDFVAGSATAVMMFRFFVIPGPLSMRWTILRRLAFLSGIIFFFRAFSIAATVLPNPDDTCKCTLDNLPCSEEDLQNIFWFALQVFFTRGVTCMDVLFSGHTVALTISLMFLLEYVDKAPWFSWALSEDRSWGVTFCYMNIKLICFLYAVLGYICIIGSRFHYTVDVIIGLLVTVLVFKGYHHAIKVSVTSMTADSTWIQWFEQTALDVRVWSKLAQRRLELKNQEVTLIVAEHDYTRGDRTPVVERPSPV